MAACRPIATATALAFDDTASTGSVTLAGTFSPFIVVFGNNSLAYTLSGSGSIAGSVTLTKQGAGTLAINMANNTYSGGTSLAGGVLQIGANSTVSGGALVAGPLGHRTADAQRRHLAGRRRRPHPGQRRRF